MVCSSSDEVGSSRTTSCAGSIRHRERPRDLDHLASSDRQALHEIASCDAVTGKDFVELFDDELFSAFAPAEAGQGAVEHPCVFRHRQVGAERQFLEYATDAERLGFSCAVALLLGAADFDATRVGRDAADQHMHECRLAGAVVADEANALARGDFETDPVERADGAERLFDAAQFDK